MTTRDAHFLARWSRRKEAVRQDEAREAEPPPDRALAERPADPLEETGADPAESPAEPLPSLEDLTAESDLSAFLRKGVPPALRAAALRKAWSLDPAIRDFVGLSENAWDFNDPASIPGFGAMTGSARDLLARVAPGSVPTQALPTLPRLPEAGAPADAARNEPSTAETVEHPPPTDPDPTAVSASDNDVEEGQSDATGPRRRHGGATPT